jgi:hypothetical protein
VEEHVRVRLRTVSPEDPAGIVSASAPTGGIAGVQPHDRMVLSAGDNLASTCTRCWNHTQRCVPSVSDIGGAAAAADAPQPGAQA